MLFELLQVDWNLQVLSSEGRFLEIHRQEAQLDKKTSLQPQPKKIQIVKIGKLIQDGGCSSNFF